ncbi:MAG: site-specific integrase [Oceanisphaera sp.]|uniref:tyrosine-type recombinase/integrase n=1 Tax=Oceanisphaera sp. TaxID=1929979 RepID=UPI003C72C8D7
MAVSDSKLRALLGKKHSDKYPRRLADRGGLSILHRGSGVLSFEFRYRFAGKQNAVTLGTYTNNDAGIKLAEARRKAEQCQAWLDDGRNPATMLKLAKNERLKPVTVRDALGYWINNYAKENRRNIDRHIMQLEKWVYPRIGELPLADCETRHWLEVFDAYRKTAPVAAGYCFQLCKQALKYCRVRRYATSNALDDLTVVDVGKKQGKRDRILNMDELRDVLRWSGEITTNRYYGNLACLLLAFGARSQEVRLSQLREWDLDACTWTVPTAHSKTSTKIIRPIPDRVKPFIKELMTHAKVNKSIYLLGELKRPEAVSQAGRQIWKRLQHKEPWTWHDLRRSLATHLNEAGVAPHVVELILGHTLPGVMAHYVHTSRLPEQKAALELWQNILNDQEEQNNVVNLRG